jgi:hypothetical protein
MGSAYSERLTDVTGPIEVTIMNTFLEQEIYIRLAEDQTAFVCTVKYGNLSTATEFPLKREPIPDVADEKALQFAKRRSTRQGDHQGRSLGATCRATVIEEDAAHN